jgi:hypothetical protein
LAGSVAAWRATFTLDKSQISGGQIATVTVHDNIWEVCPPPPEYIDNIREVSFSYCATASGLFIPDCGREFVIARVFDCQSPGGRLSNTGVFLPAQLCATRPTAHIEIAAPEGVTEPRTWFLRERSFNYWQGCDEEGCSTPGVTVGTITFLPQSDALEVLVTHADQGAGPFTLRPSLLTFGGAAPYPLGQHSIDLEVKCLNSSTGEVIPDCQVSLTKAAVAGSGGHLHHDQNRPSGSLSWSSGSTGSTGVRTLTYTAPEVAGQVEIETAGVASGSQASARFTVNVRMDGLEPVPLAGDGFEMDAHSVGHGSNNRYATAGVIQQLQTVVNAFRQRLGRLPQPPAEIPILVFTSISLPSGGLFDVDANGDGVIDNLWSPPHISHRFGVDADMRIRRPGVGFIPEPLRVHLETAILEADFTFPIRAESPANPGATHWHLRSRNFR